MIRRRFGSVIAVALVLLASCGARTGLRGTPEDAGCQPAPSPCPDRTHWCDCVGPGSHYCLFMGGACVDPSSPCPCQ